MILEKIDELTEFLGTKGSRIHDPGSESLDEFSLLNDNPEFGKAWMLK
jgi:hypothetical protein